MRCLKCGVEIQEPEVFCDDCKAVMAQYPVRPDAVVHIPERPAIQAEKPQKKRKQIYADYIRALRRAIKLLTGAVITLVLIVCLLGFMLYQQLQNDQRPIIGQNYTTTEQQSESN